MSAPCLFHLNLQSCHLAIMLRDSWLCFDAIRFVFPRRLALFPPYPPATSLLPFAAMLTAQRITPTEFPPHLCSPLYCTAHWPMHGLQTHQSNHAQGPRDPG